jgi:hypothetical protein
MQTEHLNSHVRNTQMARTTFSGPVASQNGFITTISNSSTGTAAFNASTTAVTMTGAGGTGGRTLFQMDTNVALGSFSNALKAEVTYGATGRTAGLGSAFVAEMTLSAGTSSGTYAPVEIELNAPTGASTGTLTSFIHASTQGAGVAAVDDNAVFFNLQGVTAGSGHIFQTGTTLGSAGATIKVRVGNTNFFLPLYATEITT